ncbi:MAG: YgjV family protein [Clostridia bacterium]|nr:YgjV family protein [Clostridia bacterium]
MVLTGQILGGVAMLVSFFIYQQSSRLRMVFLKLVTDVLWAAHFFLIGGLTGALTTAMAIFREAVFYHKDKKWGKSPLWPTLFILAYAAAAALTWKGVFSILPSCGSIIATLAYWQSDGRRAKLLLAPTSACMFVYNLYSRSYAGVVNEVVTMVSLLVYFIRAKSNDRAL